jgi:hypothetical protein
VQVRYVRRDHGIVSALPGLFAWGVNHEAEAEVEVGVLEDRIGQMQERERVSWFGNINIEITHEQDKMLVYYPCCCHVPVRLRRYRERAIGCAVPCDGLEHCLLGVHWQSCES